MKVDDYGQKIAQLQQEQRKAVDDHRTDAKARGQPLRKRRHAVRHRISGGPRRIAAIEHHPDRVDGGNHLDRLVAGERRIMRGHAEPLRAGAPAQDPLG